MKHSCLQLVAAAAAFTVGTAGPALCAEASGNAGRAVYDQWCSHCHDPGVQHPGTNALTVKYKGVKSGVIREWTDLTPQLVRFWVRNGISVMAPFRKTEIDDAQLAALAQYLSQGTSTPRL